MLTGATGGSLSIFPLETRGKGAHGGREAMQRELNCPHFPVCSALVEKMLEGMPDTTAPLLQLAEPFIPLYKEEQANQREIKVSVPQRTLRRGRRKGGWWQQEAEAERKPHSPNKD